MRTRFILLLALAAMAGPVHGEETRQARIRDIASIEGVRENPLIGYGMVVGLNGTGDRRQTVFTMQTLGNILQRMGVQIPTGTARVNNVAAVFVTASLPPFARPGTRLDITVSSMGDAKSLEGGLLLLTPLYGADGRVYAAAQGAVVLGGYSAGNSGNARQVNHPTVGRIPGGGLVERDASIELERLTQVCLSLSEPNFNTAEQVAEAINKELGTTVATAIDSRRIQVQSPDAAGHLPALMARIEKLTVEVHPAAKVVVNERTGTVVMGKDVRLSAVSVLHGSLSVEVTSEVLVSQPNPLSNGQTAVVAQPAVRTTENAARHVELSEGASVEQLVSGLQAIGATARDVIAILQAIKAAGALQADLEVL